MISDLREAVTELSAAELRLTDVGEDHAHEERCVEAPLPAIGTHFV